MSRFPFSRSALLCALLVVGIVAAGCGSSDSKSDKKNGTTTTTQFHFSGDGSAAFCKAYREFAATYTSASLDPANAPVEALAAKWAAAIDALKGLEADASPEIHADVTLLRKRVEGLQPALAVVGYDPTKVPEADQKRYQDADAQKASARLSAYSTQVCKAGSGK